MSLLSLLFIILIKVFNILYYNFVRRFFEMQKYLDFYSIDWIHYEINIRTEYVQIYNILL